MSDEGTTGQANAGPQPSPGAATSVVEMTGVLWASQKGVVESVLGRRPGVLAVAANPVGQTATVTFDPRRTSISEIAGWIRECGYHCSGASVPQHLCEAATSARDTAGHDTAGHDTAGHDTAGHDTAGHDTAGHEMAGMSMAGMVADLRRRFLVAAVLSVPILLWSSIGRDVLGFDVAAPFGLRDDVFQLILSVPVVCYSASIFFIGAWRALRARTLDMMVLVAVAVSAGWGYSVSVTLTGGGEVFYEAACVLTAFVLLGHWFEMRARGGANDAVRALLQLAPPRAVVIRDGREVEIPTAEVVVGNLLLVRPGAKVAVDGLVEAGSTDLDESMVTGESLPVHKAPGDEVIGASVNTTGTVRVRATRIGADTALAQIVQLVQEAQNSRAPGQRLADRAAFWLVLTALITGAATFAVWMLASDRPATDALLFAITVVVVTCPDALGLATPTAIMVGTGLGAERGILFKHATAIESAARVDTVVMDKTGTLTLGEPQVTDVIAAGIDRSELLRLAAAVEHESEHPIARAIVRAAAERGAAPLQVTEFESVPGEGARGRVDGQHVVVGNPTLVSAQFPRGGVAVRELESRALESAADRLSRDGKTAVLIGVDGRGAGVVGLADAPRPTAAAAIADLRGTGVRVAMLTGDNALTARRIAAGLGIDEVIAQVRPADKADRVVARQGTGRVVAMVGDGVNDAPALARADVGVAIGAGTDVAIETADVVLMRSDPFDVPVALRIGRATLRKMRQNLGWAIGYNSVALPIAAGVFEPAFGLVLRPEIAALAMSGSSLLVAVNALLLKRLRLPLAPRPEPAPPAAASAGSDGMSAGAQLTGRS